jgi:hypothetical protein
LTNPWMPRWEKYSFEVWNTTLESCSIPML